MRYYIAYPISFDCNLKCSYCFHAEHHQTNFAMKRTFSVDDYKRWRDTHLKDAEEIIVHFHGGEPLLDTTIGTIKALLNSTTMEKADLLTNGIQNIKNYAQLIPYKDRIHRIGFTWHRKVIGNVDYLYERFKKNLMLLHNAGINVYAKELLFVEFREEIREAKRYWKSLNIPFKIQDFKGEKRGRDFEEWAKYNALDWYLVDAEYKRGGENCSCFKGYKNVLIRGGWNDGDILACFEDPVVVGSIQKNEFHSNFQIYKDFKAGHITVLGVDTKYKGTRERDVYDPRECGAN
jgi:pyruvate-formate lyase-activating enzyme